MSTCAARVNGELHSPPDSKQRYEELQRFKLETVVKQAQDDALDLAGPHE